MKSDKVKENLVAEINTKVKELKEEEGISPKITLIRVGEDGGSIAYEKSVMKMADKFGIEVDQISLDEKTTSTFGLSRVIMATDNTSGVLLFQPLPKKINNFYTKLMIKPHQDIDCHTLENQGRFYSDKPSFIPCTVESVMLLLKSYNIELEGKDVVVLGRSNVVGKPLANALLGENATVTICHSKTKNIKDKCKNADILISAIGKPNFVTKDMVKRGSVVVDVGTTYIDDNLYGDVDFERVKDKVSYITPVLNGVGSLTTLLLLRNAVDVL